MKDKAKRNEMSNYRPIICLSLMWKLLTGVMADDIYNHLKENDLLPVKQDCCKNNRGMKEGPFAYR